MIGSRNPDYEVQIHRDVSYRLPRSQTAHRTFRTSDPVTRTQYRFVSAFKLYIQYNEGGCKHSNGTDLGALY